jgi:hypothetical protein
VTSTDDSTTRGTGRLVAKLVSVRRQGGPVREVVEVVEVDVTARLGEAVVAAGASDPAAALRAATDGWLDAAQEPEVRQLLLLDAPSVSAGRSSATSRSATASA